MTNEGRVVLPEVNVQHLHQDHDICDASLGNHLHIFLKISSLLPESEDPRLETDNHQNQPAAWKSGQGESVVQPEARLVQPINAELTRRKRR